MQPKPSCLRVCCSRFLWTLFFISCVAAVSVSLWLFAPHPVPIAALSARR
jgi:hypothetical protein